MTRHFGYYTKASGVRNGNCASTCFELSYGVLHSSNLSHSQRQLIVETAAKSAWKQNGARTCQALAPHP